MDRRQRKTRGAILNAFTELLAIKHVSKITVGDIIEKADVGRATFYSHFESKELLLNELLGELLCHVFDNASNTKNSHKHFFDCETKGSVFYHLFEHFSKNDRNILKLMSGENYEIFIPYLQNGVKRLCESDPILFDREKSLNIPHDLWLQQASSAFINTITYWIKNEKKESSNELEAYFYTLIGRN